MADHITDEAVEAAARAYYAAAFDDLHPSTQALALSEARAALAAALPVLDTTKDDEIESLRASVARLLDTAEVDQRQIVRQMRRIDEHKAEIASLTKRVDAVSHLHREFRLYGECGHHHTEEGNGVISVENVGLTCADGYERSICRECCTSGSDYQTEECAANHEHNCWPCRTHEAAVNAVAASLRGERGE